MDITEKLEAPWPLDRAARDRSRAVALMVAGGALLGTLGVFLEEAGQHPLTAVWFRCAFGLLALLAWGAWRGRLGELQLTRKAACVAIGAGVLMVLNWALFFAAIPRTSIAVATVAFHVQPVWVMLFGMVWLGEPKSPSRIVAVLAALAGLGVATGMWPQGFDMAQQGFMLGLLFALGGSLSYAAVTLIAARSREISSFALSAWQCLVGAVLLCWWPVVDGWPQQASAWMWLAGLGVIHTALAYVVLYAGMQRLQAGQIALLQFVYPVCAIVLDAVVYGRPLSPLQLVGVVVMGAALWIARPARR